MENTFDGDSLAVKHSNIIWNIFSGHVVIQVSLILSTSVIPFSS